MTCISISPAAYHAICSTLPEDAPLWSLQRQGGNKTSSTSRRPPSTVWGPWAWPGESYSDVILRLVELEAARR